MADQKPPKESIGDKLLRGVKSAVELRIITVVGEVTVSGDLSNPTVSFGRASKDALVTSVKLVEGDITNVIPAQFWAPDKDDVRKFHEQQVVNGNKIVERNLKVISEVGEKLAQAIAALRGAEDTSSG